MTDPVIRVGVIGAGRVDVAARISRVGGHRHGPEERRRGCHDFCRVHDVVPFFFRMTEPLFIDSPWPGRHVGEAGSIALW